MKDLLIRFPTSKSGVDQFVDEIRENILDYGEDALPYALMIKSMAEIVAVFNKEEEIQDAINNEFTYHAEKEFTERGVKYQVRETGVKYNFSGCGHSGWNDFDKLVKDATQKRKDIETTLKTIKSSSPELVDAETGEMLRPPSKTSTTKVIITLPK